MQRRPALRDDRTDAGCVLRSRHAPKCLGRDQEGGCTQSALFAHEPASDGNFEEGFAVKHGVDVPAVFDGRNDVSHTFREECAGAVAVGAIGLETVDLVEDGVGDSRIMNGGSV